MERAGSSFTTFRNFETHPEGRAAGPVAPDPSSSGPRSSGFVAAAWSLLALNVAAVGWGVFLRAGRFGDGCGANWPFCGDSNPMRGQISRLIEGSHRAMTGLIGLLAIVLALWARRLFPKGHPARRFALAQLGFTVFEGLVGAALVKFGWVTNNPTPARAAVMSLHVVSTFLLLGSVAATALAAGTLRPPRPKEQGPIPGLLVAGFVGLVVLGISGAVNAFAHQVNPVEDVLRTAMSPDAPWMVRLQPLHPLLSVSVGLYLVLMAGLVGHLRPDPLVARTARLLVLSIGLQMVVGLVNVWFRAAIPMQILHLVAADLNLVAFVALGLAAVQTGIERVESRAAPERATPDPALPPTPLKGRGLVSAYVALTKPRVVSLLLFTTLTAAVAAAGGWPGFVTTVSLLLGGYMSAGAANAINMVIDRDIDLEMARTAKRPTVQGAITPRSALVFAAALAFGAFAILWAGGTLLAAVMALCGLVFYVVVYTLGLKRRTPHNIVIGGAAGAFPPLVGWAGVTGNLPPLALYLFAIVFLWTPWHFWALAIWLKDEYRAASIPMLPVVRGERHTVVQIGLYALLTILVTLAPLLQPRVGWLYGGAAVVLNVGLVWMFAGLARQVDRKRAFALFKFSMAYLALLFLALAVDRTVLS